MIFGLLARTDVVLSLLFVTALGGVLSACQPPVNPSGPVVTPYVPGPVWLETPLGIFRARDLDPPTDT